MSENSPNIDPAEDVLVLTKRHHPAFDNGSAVRRIVTNPTPGGSSFSLGYSVQGFGQIGGNVDRNQEPSASCVADEPLNEKMVACICYVGSGLEDQAPDVVEPNKFLDDNGDPLTGTDLAAALAALEYDSYYQRLLNVGPCFKVLHHDSIITNLTSAPLELSIGDDTDPDDPGSLTRHANSIEIPAGESLRLADNTLLPDAHKDGSVVGIDKDGKETNCLHWLTVCFQTAVPKGEKVLFQITGVQL